MLNQSKVIEYVPIDSRDGVCSMTLTALFPIACIPKPFRYEYLKSTSVMLDRERLRAGFESAR